MVESAVPSTNRNALDNDDVVQKAAMLSENIVKILMMQEANHPSSPEADGSFSSSFSGSGADKRLSWQDASSSSSLPTVSIDGSDGAKLSPAAFLMQELGNLSGTNPPAHSIAALDNAQLFQHCTAEDRTYYDKDAVQAIHTRDVATLRAWHQQGRPLQTSNRFGETLLHIACRRGYLDVVMFLLLEANLTLWVHDDQGKTPLHLACFSALDTDGDDEARQALFSIMDLAIQQDADLLYIADRRGCMPFDYAPRDSWDDWINYIRGKGEIGNLMPRRALFFAPVVAKPATEGASSGVQQQQPPAQPVPFLADVDQILAEYAQSRRKSKKKKKKSSKSSSSNNNHSSSSGRSSMSGSSFLKLGQEMSPVEESPASTVSLKQKLTAAIMEKMSHSSLDDIAMLDAEALLSTLQLQGRRVHEGERTASRRVSMPSGENRIDQLRNLEALQIEHIKMGTTVEIAIEMERSAKEALAAAQLRVQEARREYDSLAYSIQCAQDNLKGGPVKQLGIDGDSSFSNRSDQGSMASGNDAMPRSSEHSVDATLPPSFPLCLSPL